jgi:hypothetical protein
MMTRPNGIGELLSLLGTREPQNNFVQIKSHGGDVCVSRDEIIVIDGDIFVRQFTPDDKGGGFVALKARVPQHIAIPWNWYVYPGTYVFDDAQLYLGNAGPHIRGSAHGISRTMRPRELSQIAAQATERIGKLLGERREPPWSHVSL